MNSRLLGKEGEKIAEDFLRRKGYKILEKNFIPKDLWPQRGEIDIIAENKGRIVFVEVKSSFSRSYISPEARVNSRKFKRIEKVAKSYLFEKGITSQNWQVDIISIKKEGDKVLIKHFENIFSEEGIF